MWNNEVLQWINNSPGSEVVFYYDQQGNWSQGWCPWPCFLVWSVQNTQKCLFWVDHMWCCNFTNTWSLFIYQFRHQLTIYKSSKLELMLGRLFPTTYWGAKIMVFCLGPMDRNRPNGPETRHWAYTRHLILLRSFCDALVRRRRNWNHFFFGCTSTCFYLPASLRPGTTFTWGFP
jgi:hypothetical protein